MFPLSLASLHQRVQVVKITGQFDLKHRLEKLGFVPGTPCQIFQNNQGNLIVEILESKLALSKELSTHIMVKEIDNEVK